MHLAVLAGEDLLQASVNILADMLLAPSSF